MTNAHSLSSIAQCRLISLDVFPDVNGKLAVVESGGRFPFDIRRFFFLYDVPSEAVRGGHSHYVEQQLILSITGSFDVIVDDGVHKRTITLNRPNVGLYVPPGIWRELNNFTSGAVCAVLSSTDFRESDYVRDYERFVSLTRQKQ